MSGSKSETSNISAENVRAILWGIAGLMVFVGSLVLIGTLQQPTQKTSHSGILVDATASSGVRGRHNNTTLIIQNEAGEMERYELGSTLQVRKIPEIRDRARAHKGKRVVYETIDHSRGRLISVETLDGTSIVSAQYTLAAVQFGACMAIILGIGFAVAGSYHARQHRTS